MGQDVSLEITAGEEGGGADIAGELLVLLSTDGMFELSVYPQVVLLGAAEAAVLADPGPLPAVCPQVDQEAALLAEHLLTHLTRVALGVTQVLVLVSQLVGGELLITELAGEPLLLLPGVVAQLVVLAAAECLERFLVITARKSAVVLLLPQFVVLKLEHWPSLAFRPSPLFFTTGCCIRNTLTCLNMRIRRLFINKICLTRRRRVFLIIDGIDLNTIKCLFIFFNVTFDTVLGPHHELLLLDVEQVADVGDAGDVRPGEAGDGPVIGEVKHPVHLLRGEVGYQDTEVLLVLHVGHDGVEEGAEPGQDDPVSLPLSMITDQESHIRRTGGVTRHCLLLSLESDQL